MRGLRKRSIFLKVIHREVLIGTEGLEKIEKLISGGGPFIWYQRVLKQILDV